MTSAAHPPPLLAAIDVMRRFDDVTAVDRVSLTVGPGEIVGLLGANGAGKTTLIRMMLGLVGTSEGQVTMFGTTPSRTTRRRLGYVPQGLGLYLDMTVGENVAFQAAAFGVAPTDIALTDELRAMTHRLVGSIGLGRQRQLAFACALGHHPEVVVLDEPTSGVDALARARLWDAIRSEASRNVGVLVTTHYMEEAQQCDRLVLMANGRVAAHGTVEDIVAGRTVIEVTAGSWADAFTSLSDAGFHLTLAGRRLRVASTDEPGVRRTLQESGLVAEVRIVSASLEEAMVAGR